MVRAIDAVYENGTFRPVHGESLAMQEGQRVRITIDDGLPEALRLATSVFDGLSHDDMNAVEKIALDRTGFFDSRDEN